MRWFYVIIIALSACSGKKIESSQTPAINPQKEFLSEIKSSSLSSGTKMGVINIGSSGFDAFHILVDQNKNWKLVKADYNPSKIHENEVSLANITKGLKDYRNEMIMDSIDQSNIHIIISSSAAINPRLAGINAVLEKVGIKTTSVTASEEGRYGFLATIPENLKTKSFMVDIGSGNTKISWMDNGEIKTLETFGSKYYQQGTPDQLVYNEVSALAKEVPKISTKYCIVIGGGPYQLVQNTEKQKERYSFMGPPDSYDIEGSDQLNCVINTYSAIREATNCNLFVFDWDSNYSVGYLLEKK